MFKKISLSLTAVVMFFAVGTFLVSANLSENTFPSIGGRCMTDHNGIVFLPPLEIQDVRLQTIQEPDFGQLILHVNIAQ